MSMYFHIMDEREDARRQAEERARKEVEDARKEYIAASLNNAAEAVVDGELTLAKAARLFKVDVEKLGEVVKERGAA